VPLTNALPVSETTVVPAPAVTVPVTTTGKAVVLCPPAIHITPPVALIDGTAVVPSSETVPDTSAEPVKLTTVVPAPAVTVPVTTTGVAVELWPPPIHTTIPVALTDGPAVVTL
jgi:hypothetical protein